MYRGPLSRAFVNLAGRARLWQTLFGHAKLARIAPNRGRKINANFFGTKFFDNPSGHGRPRRKSWTSAPKSAFSCGPSGGEKLFDPWASGRKGQECPREIRTKKFMFMLFFLPRPKPLGAGASSLFGEKPGSPENVSCTGATRFGPSLIHGLCAFLPLIHG